LRGRNEPPRRELAFVTIDSSLLIENEARKYAAAYGVYTSGSELRNQGRKEKKKVKVQQRASEKNVALQAGIHQGDEKAVLKDILLVPLLGERRNMLLA
jgi:hypothetical protein